MKRTNNLLIAAGLATTLLAGACGENTESATSTRPSIDDTSASVTNTAADRDLLAPVTDGSIRLPNGWFEMTGYGQVLHVDGDRITPHYVTTSTCVVGDGFDNNLDVDHATDDGVITVDLVGPTTDYRLLPLTGPVACESDQSQTVIALDELFASHYPFFEQRGTDWPSELAAIRAAVDTDPERFADALQAFMLRLGDGHTTLDGLDIDPDIGAFGLDGPSTLDDLEAAIGEEFDRTLASVEDLTTDRTGSVAWGQIDADTGYLIMVAFEGISGDDDPAADRSALRDALDEAVTDLAHNDRLVIDMRFNGGGYEDLAVLAAGYFVDQPAPAYRKWAHAQPDAFVQTVEVDPQGASYEGSVAVVTSPITASAAEVFTLAMVEVADADVVGSPSFGEFSDAIDWVLPDGTEFTLSMENYTDLAGTNHEGTGIPVDVSAPLDGSIHAAAEHLTARTSAN